MSYTAAKHLHVTCVVLSISLFVLRGGLQLAGKPWRKSLSLRIAPHLIDTVLLGSALWMVFATGMYPFVHGWLTAKLLALLAYILLGRLALASNTAASQRPVAFVAALACVTYIVGVAMTHSPSWGLL